MVVIKVSDYNELKNLIKSGVSFIEIKSAKNAPCNFVRPVFEEASEKNTNIKFFEIDLDEAKQNMPQVIRHVTELPHFDLFHNGKLLFQFSGVNLYRIHKCIDLLNTRYQKDLKDAEYKNEDNQIISKLSPAKTNFIKVSNSKELSQLTSSGFSFVFISAEWSRPSKTIEPIFDEYAKSNYHIKFILIDINDGLKEMPNEMMRISSIPHFELYQNGKILFQFTAPNIDQIKKSVDLLNSRYEKIKRENQVKKVDVKCENQNTNIE